jgi:hypothetical protein
MERDTFERRSLLIALSQDNVPRARRFEATLGSETSTREGAGTIEIAYVPGHISENELTTVALRLGAELWPVAHLQFICFWPGRPNPQMREYLEGRCAFDMGARCTMLILLRNSDLLQDCNVFVWPGEDQ